MAFQSIVNAYTTSFMIVDTKKSDGISRKTLRPPYHVAFKSQSNANQDAHSGSRKENK